MKEAEDEDIYTGAGELHNVFSHPGEIRPGRAEGEAEIPEEEAKETPSESLENLPGSAADVLNDGTLGTTKKKMAKKKPLTEDEKDEMEKLQKLALVQESWVRDAFDENLRKKKEEEKSISKKDDSNNKNTGRLFGRVSCIPRPSDSELFVNHFNDIHKGSLNGDYNDYAEETVQRAEKYARERGVTKHHRSTPDNVSVLASFHSKMLHSDFYKPDGKCSPVRNSKTSKYRGHGTSGFCLRKHDKRTAS